MVHRRRGQCDSNTHRILITALLSAYSLISFIPSPRPSTKMTNSHQPHVLVIGAGIVGASIAWHLSKSTKVTIIAEDIGGPASSASFAWLNASSASDKSYHDFRVRSLKRWKEIE